MQLYGILLLLSSPVRKNVNNQFLIPTTLISTCSVMDEGQDISMEWQCGVSLITTHVLFEVSALGSPHGGD